MKRQFFSIFAAGSLVVMLAAAPLFAQSTQTMKAQIPFGFVVGNRTFPAGEYTVGPAGAVLQIRSTDGKKSIYALHRSVQRPVTESQWRLVFNQYGDTYFLSELWRPGDNTGQQLVMSSHERELAQSKATLQVKSLVAQQR